MAEIPIHQIRQRRLPVFVKKAVLNDFFYIIILFINDLFAVIFIYNAAYIHRVIRQHHLVLFQKLNGMPAQIVHSAVAGLKNLFDLPDLFFQISGIAHNHALRSFLIMMHHRMEQDIQSGSLSC